MKLGYPTLNLALGCTSSHTFRLALFTEERFVRTVQHNLDCLRRMLEWNVAHDLLFYRIASGLIPFASHENMTVPWWDVFRDELVAIGDFIKQHDMRISMHPGHFVVINALSEVVWQNSAAELAYHAELLDCLGLDVTHKMQIHLGGIYGDRSGSLELFASRYQQLARPIKERLVVENDERSASVQDCQRLHQLCGIPVLFDTLHHQIYNHGESLLRGLDMAIKTWKVADGIPMIDYSNQDPNKRTGAHAQTIDVEQFRRFIKSLKQRDVDIMFEIKNKEASALQAYAVLQSLQTSFLEG
jgi:UV DNA damage endonuclease